MKIKYFLVIGAIALFFVAGLSVYYYQQNPEKKGFSIQPLGNKGVFVGEKRAQYKESDPSKWSEQTRQRVEEYEASVKSIDDAWDYMSLAGSHDKEGRYEEAANAYKKAYLIGGGSQAVSGLKLAIDLTPLNWTLA